MKQEVKVVEIPATATAVQMETALQNQTNKGWQLVAVFPLGTKTFVVLVRVVAV